MFVHVPVHKFEITNVGLSVGNAQKGEEEKRRWDNSLVNSHFCMFAPQTSILSFVCAIFKTHCVYTSTATGMTH